VLNLREINFRSVEENKISNPQLDKVKGDPQLESLVLDEQNVVKTLNTADPVEKSLRVVSNKKGTKIKPTKICLYG